jgi:roadblock/LC7 domain-containing protein
VEELTSQIKGFDSSYQYSDDGSVYRYWSAIQKEIRIQLSTLPGSFISAITGQLSNSNKIHSFI